MDLIYILGLFVLITALFFITLIMLIDCDVLTFFADKLGKRPGSVFGGQVVWLTGASSGIGQSMAIELAKCGARLVLSARRKDELERVKNECLKKNRSLGEKDVLVLPLDVVDLESHEPSLRQILQHFGKLDVLISCAGRYLRGDWHEVDLLVDRQLFEVNVFSVVNMNRLVVKHFLQAGRGQVGVVTSMAGRLPLPLSGPYAASKHALHGYFNTLRMETYGKNIDVTLICPGPVDTGMFNTAFTHSVGVTTEGNRAPELSENHLSPDRCAHLSLVGIANRLSECWLSKLPVVQTAYFGLYFPILCDLLMRLTVPMQIRRMKRI